MESQAQRKGLFFRVNALLVLSTFVFTSVCGFAPRAIAADNLSVPKVKKDSRLANQLKKDLMDGGDTVPLSERLVVAFSELGKNDLAIAGGKGANLGELTSLEKDFAAKGLKGIAVPGGIAVTTKAFRMHIDKGIVDKSMVNIGNKETMPLREYIDYRLKKLEATKRGYTNTRALAEAGQDIRIAIQMAKMPAEVKDEITRWYKEMGEGPVAVRSSATAEDLPDASFAGQQDTYLNIRGIEAVLDATQRDWASLFTDRAIFYRHEQKIDHGTAELCVVIQRMVNSKTAGTAFSVNVGTGFDTTSIDAAPGLGEGVVSGTVSPDHWEVHKDPKTGKFRIVRFDFGDKLSKYVYKTEKTEQAPSTAGLLARILSIFKKPPVVNREGTELIDTSYTERHTRSLTDEQVLELAQALEIISKHYDGRIMDVEWAFDADGKLWILQARSETIWNQWKEKHPNTVKIENLVVSEEESKKAAKLLSGVAGSKSATGKVVVIDSRKTGVELAKELARIQKGDILVTEMTKPDMVPVMKIAGAIVTDQGGPTCHAAIVARELGIACIVGSGNATQVLKNGMVITVDANRGKVYAGKVKIDKIEKNISTDELNKKPTKTKIGIIVASPILAMSVSGLSEYISHYGVSLMRKEVVDATEIMVHPLAGLAYDRYKTGKFKDQADKEWIEKNIMNNEQLRSDIERAIRGYNSYAEFYKDKLANALALIAATQTKGQRVKFRTTDFKTNEYKEQIGGPLFEPDENNPMMGNRGIYRMLSASYKEAFELELQAIKLAREKQSNIDVMFPVVRSVEEMKEAAALMAKYGLFEGDSPAQVGIMVEAAVNVIMAEEFFSALSDLAKSYGTKAFMSIGSNDLTQFTLGLGRDNGKMKPFFNEADPAVKKAIEIVIKTAKKYGITTGLCGQRPSNDPAFGGFLVWCGIDSIGVVPEVYDDVHRVVYEQEQVLAKEGYNPEIVDWARPSTLKMGQPGRITAKEVDASNIIKSLGIHPKALLFFNKSIFHRAFFRVSQLMEFYPGLRKLGRKTPKQYVVDAVYNAVIQKAQEIPANTPLVYSTDDLTKVSYEALDSGKQFEEFDENPVLGFNGLARVVDPEYEEFFRWQLEGIKKARQVSGKNIIIRLDLVRFVPEVEKALKIIKESGLTQEPGFKVGMELAVLSNVLRLEDYVKAGVSFFSENKDRYLSYVIEEDPRSEFIQIQAERKEKAWENSQKVWTSIAEKNNVAMVNVEAAQTVGVTADGGTPVTQRAVNENLSRINDAAAKINSAGLKVYKTFSTGYGNMMNKVRDAKVEDEDLGAVVIGSNVVLDHADTVEALKKLKEARPGMRIFVWGQIPVDTKAENKKQAEENLSTALAATGINEVADEVIKGSKVDFRSFEEVLDDLGEIHNISQLRTMAVLSEQDKVNLEKEVKRSIKEFSEINMNLKITVIKDAGKGEAVPMTAVLANIVTRNLKNDAPELKDELSKLVTSTYKDNPDAQKELTDLTASLVEISPVGVDEETDAAARQYKEMTRKIESGV